MQMRSTLRASAAALAFLMAAQPAGASEYSALMKARKYPEAERAAAAKLAQDPANAEAMAARSDAILAAGSEARIEEAVKQSEQCVAALEQALAKSPKPHILYRIGQSQQALGEKAKAAAAYEKALAFKSGMSKKMRADAEDQLKALKG